MTGLRADRRTGAAERPGGRLSGLATAALTVVGLLAGVVLWLAFTADETMDGLRAAAMDAVPRVVLDIPDVPSAAAAPEAETALPVPPVSPPAESSPPISSPTASSPAVSSSPPVVAAVTPETTDGGGAPEQAPLVIEQAPEPEAPVPPDPPAAEVTGDEPPSVDVASLSDALPPVEVAPVDSVLPAADLPWRDYAQPFDSADPRPRIAIIITDLGQSDSETRTAIQNLPGPVTLAFAPYAPNLDVWIPSARAAGHEALIMVPMEPQSYPLDDPGPHTLLSSVPDAENRERLDWVVDRADGVVGIINEMGDRFTLLPDPMRSVIAHAGQRGLMVVDSGANVLSSMGRVAGDLGVPYATADRVVDDFLSRDAIDARLGELETLAAANGVAIGTAAAYPVVLERVGAWLPELEERGFVLVPITAVATAGR